MGIQKIEFTGGTTPFLWFGDQKSDNDFQGGGENGELLAQVFTQLLSGEVRQVDFFIDEILQFSDTIAPYEFDWIQPSSGTHEVFAVAINDADSVAVSQVINIEITIGTVATTSIENDQPQITVFPNPASTELYFSVDSERQYYENKELQIYDITGRLIDRLPLLSGIQLDQISVPISHLPQGSYLLKLMTKQGEFFLKKFTKAQ